ncbi:MAG TPA: hypothetical protein VFV08_09210, partial [Puia sp.]|nr:hypothetical protein [Puia sp.]
LSFFCALLCLTIRSFCQEVTLLDGDFKALTGQSYVSLKFTYDSLQVGKYKNESDYVAKRVEEINKKYPGKGNDWAAEWVGQRKLHFEPAFSKAFMQGSGKDTLVTAAYTLIFNTYYIEQGFSSAAILVHKNPEIRGELILIKTGDSTQILGRARVIKALGKAGPHFETGEHIDGAYTEAGSALGEFILNH